MRFTKPKTVPVIEETSWFSEALCPSVGGTASYSSFTINLSNYDLSKLLVYSVYCIWEDKAGKKHYDPVNWYIENKILKIKSTLRRDNLNPSVNDSVIFVGFYLNNDGKPKRTTPYIITKTIAANTTEFIQEYKGRIAPLNAVTNGCIIENVQFYDDNWTFIKVRNTTDEEKTVTLYCY